MFVRVSLTHFSNSKVFLWYCGTDTKHSTRFGGNNESHNSPRLRLENEEKPKPKLGTKIKNINNFLSVQIHSSQFIINSLTNIKIACKRFNGSAVLAFFRAIRHMLNRATIWNGKKLFFIFEYFIFDQTFLIYRTCLQRKNLFFSKPIELVCRSKSVFTQHQTKWWDKCNHEILSSLHFIRFIFTLQSSLQKTTFKILKINEQLWFFY